jgi:ADP-ribosylglycohydrolase
MADFKPPKIVLNPEYLDKPEDVAYRFWVKSMRNAAPNGSLMRTHPLGIMCLPFSREATFRTAMEYSRVTHVDPRCVLSCCICSVLISEMLKGIVLTEEDVDEVLEAGFTWVDTNYRPDPDMQESLLDRQEFRHHVYAKALAELQLDDSMKIGYVYKCLGSAILCLRLAMRAPTRSTSTFEMIITELVMDGGDADTNACCAGALLGAFLGYSRLPHHWRDGLMHHDWLVEKVQSLCHVVGISNGHYSGADDPDAQTDDERGRLPQETLDMREKTLVSKVLLKDKERRENEASEKRGKHLNISRFFGMKSQS